MKFQRFFGLLHREWQRHAAHFYLSVVSLIVYLVLIPLTMAKFFPQNWNLEDTVMSHLIAFMVFFVLIPIQLAFNIRQENKQSDIWLHTPAPFWQLISAKLLYYLAIAIIHFGLISISLLTALRIIQDTSVIDFIPIIFTTVFISSIEILSLMIFILLAVVFVLFFKRYMGWLAYIVTIVLMTALIFIELLLEEIGFYNDFIYSGVNLMDFIPLPQAYETTLLIELSDFFYVKDIVLYFIIYAVLTFFVIKWLERVIKR
ncbi:MAG: hypothetical protein KBT36_10970 [Kurthia sp.]|nr:hypothetical protein [Candidatus Kurthia equi]